MAKRVREFIVHRCRLYLISCRSDYSYRKAKDLGWEKINPSSPHEINKKIKHAGFDVVEIGSTSPSPSPLVNVLSWIFQQSMRAIGAE
jgi:hypothetical protein